jgi:hypothetical protein
LTHLQQRGLIHSTTHKRRYWRLLTWQLGSTGGWRTCLANQRPGSLQTRSTHTHIRTHTWSYGMHWRGSLLAPGYLLHYTRARRLYAYA